MGTDIESRFVGLLLALFLSSFLFFGGIFFANILPFYKPLSFDILLAALLDWFLSLLMVVVVFASCKGVISFINESFDNDYRFCIERLKPVLCFFVLVLFYLIYERIDIIISGATREMLVFDEDKSRWLMILSPLFTMLTAISFVYSYSVSTRLICAIGLICVMIYSLSRTELLTCSTLAITALVLKGVSLKSIFRLFIVICLIVFLGATMTILQGRAESIDVAINSLLESLFKYRAFSLYLSEYSIDAAKNNFEMILFPFFGFFIERFLSLFSALSNPISVNGSTFVSDFRFLGAGTALSANVLYPWWSWFFGVFGVFGVVIKAFFSFLLFYIFKFHLKLCVLYLLYVSLFSGFVKHPFLNNDSVYFILVFVALDVFVLYSSAFKAKKQHGL